MRCSSAEVLSAAIGEDGGARQTGGGFGGAVVALLRETEAKRVAGIVAADYRTPAGDPPHIMMESVQEAPPS